MSIQVSGTLLNPIGEALEITIRITAENSNIALEGSYASVTTTATGVYNFNLEDGVYLIQLLQLKEYTEGTTILVDNTVATPITLGALLASHKVVI